MTNNKRGSPLTSEQKGGLQVFLKLLADGHKFTYTYMGKLVGCSRQTVRAYLHNPSGYGKKKRPGRPRKLGPREDRRVRRGVLQEGGWTSAARLARLLAVSRNTILRSIHRNDGTWSKAKRVTDLDNDHQLTRVNWALDFLRFPFEDLKKIVFSDEKRFTLDGPDGLDYYWKMPGCDEQVKLRHQQWGGSTMVWAAFSFGGQSQLCFCTGHMDRYEYTSMLEQNLIPFGDDVVGHGWVFQQDNCSVHLAGYTRAWFADNDIRVLKWPSISPDLNPIENLWGILSRLVYNDGKKQFNNIVELKAAILNAWRLIPAHVLQGLVLDMPRRFVSTIVHGGAKINR